MADDLNLLPGLKDFSRSKAVTFTYNVKVVISQKQCKIEMS